LLASMPGSKRLAKVLQRLMQALLVALAARCPLTEVTLTGRAGCWRVELQPDSDAGLRWFIAAAGLMRGQWAGPCRAPSSVARAPSRCRAAGSLLASNSSLAWRSGDCSHSQQGGAALQALRCSLSDGAGRLRRRRFRTVPSASAGARSPKGQVSGFLVNPLPPPGPGPVRAARASFVLLCDPGDRPSIQRPRAGGLSFPARLRPRPPRDRSRRTTSAQPAWAAGAGRAASGLRSSDCAVEAPIVAPSRNRVKLSPVGAAWPAARFRPGVGRPAVVHRPA